LARGIRQACRGTRIARWSLRPSSTAYCLIRFVALTPRAGGRSMRPKNSSRWAADKHVTAERLAAAGVAAPRGRLVEADEAKMPGDFEYPGVLKPVDGAGSQHTILVQGPGDQPEPYPWPRRLEQYCPGRAASVAALCGPGRRAMLPPCGSTFREDGRFAYRGGAIIGEATLIARATAIASQGARRHAAGARLRGGSTWSLVQIRTVATTS